jgi:hypothetical protein
MAFPACIACVAALVTGLPVRGFASHVYTANPACVVAWPAPSSWQRRGNEATPCFHVFFVALLRC